MQEQINRASKYELFIGTRTNQTVDQKSLVGFTFIEPDANYYKVRIMMFPGITFYLSKNRDSHDHYTLFSKMVQKEDRFVFQNPVGSGFLDSNFHDYLEIRIPFLKVQMFMSLFPVKN